MKNNIKNLRTEKGISQQELAENLASKSTNYKCY